MPDSVCMPATFSGERADARESEWALTFDTNLKKFVLMARPTDVLAPGTVTFASPFEHIRDSDGQLSPGAIQRRSARLVLHALHAGLLFARFGKKASWRTEESSSDWDIDLVDHDGQTIRISVKGTADATLDRFEVSDREWKAATQHEHLYWIALVTKCAERRPAIQMRQHPVKSAREGRLVLERLEPTGYCVRVPGTVKRR